MFDLRTCVLLGPGATCENNGQCARGECQIRDPLRYGTCGDGSLGSWCQRDDQCDSKRCTRWGTGWRGFCTDGSGDAPCGVDSDCAGLRCVVPPGQPAVGCQYQGERCGRDGVGACSMNNCEYGRCG